MSDDTMLYHVALNKKMIEGAVYAVMPGDPDRVEVLAKIIDPNATPLAVSREYHSYLANLHGQPVLVCSTGIGGPSTSIAIEELACLGLRNFLRVGTTGAIQEHINVGDLIVTKASVRLDGASSHYAPIEYPAVASFAMTYSIVKAAAELAVPFHVGITASSDTFYPGQERYDSFSGYVLRRLQQSMDEWKQLKVLNFEMESSTFLTMSSALGLNAACMCGVLVNREQTECIDESVVEQYKHQWAEVAKQAIIVDMVQHEVLPNDLIKHDPVKFYGGNPF